MIGSQVIFKTLALLPFLAMIFFGLLLPSDGNHGFFSPKSLSFVGAAGMWFLFILFQRRYRCGDLYVLGIGMGIIAFITGWFFLGLLYGESPFSSQFDQYKLFIITLAVVVIAVHYAREGALSPQGLFKCAIYANFLYSSMKCLGALLHLIGVINILTFMDKVGIRFMSMDIHAGVIRLQTSVDIATPYLLLFVLNSERLGVRFPKGFRLVYICISILSVLLSFSRYLIAVSWIALFLYWVTSNTLRQFAGIITCAALVILGIAAAGPENVYKVIEKRLFSADNALSDQTRIDQIEAMSDEICSHPFLGKGLGGYAPACVRDAQLPHSYEVQWVAFTMQFGMVGITILVAVYLIAGWGYLIPPYTLPKVSFAAMYALWLVSGFTNPFLISLTSGIMYAIFALAPKALVDNSGHRWTIVD